MNRLYSAISAIYLEKGQIVVELALAGIADRRRPAGISHSPRQLLFIVLDLAADT